MAAPNRPASKCAAKRRREELQDAFGQAEASSERRCDRQAIEDQRGRIVDEVLAFKSRDDAFG
ncbi:hypothetical protein [Novosphingobium chloroacetimidivorans]|uniref:hypothetical protein n=1 Tax=Novosphingobium chloroacetimidivorans TaxID=1428314 RepID=UPI001C88455E|nr:hypothetical protein [Novosphingobium chloroacetimidivorans]